MSDKNKFSIRNAQASDQDFLYEMLYQSIFVEPGSPKPERSILNDPSISKYVEKWGKKGDYCLIALNEEGEKIGAVWLRYFNESQKGYGYISDEIPEVGIAIDYGSRGKGVGSALFEELLNRTKKIVHSISLSVQPQNYAVRLYKRFGFVECGYNGDAMIMRLDFNKE